MRKIKFLLFFILGLVLLTSCTLNHQQFPKSEVPLNGMTQFRVTVKDFETKEEIATVKKYEGRGLKLSDFSYTIPEGYEIELVDEAGNPLEIYGVYGDMDVYVRLVPKYYQLTFYEHGTVVAKEKVQYGEPLPLIEPKMVPSGYHFEGWFTSDGELVEAGVMPAHALSLYAQYSEEPYQITFAVGFDLPGLVDGCGYAEFYEGERLGDFTPTSVKEAIASLEGYHFLGWYVDSALQTPFEDVIMPSHNIKLYAKFAFEGITFNDGDVILSVPEPNEQGLIERPSDPFKNGYTFEGWFLDKEFNQPAEFPIVVTGEAYAIYAKFTPNNDTPYHVEYYLKALSGSYIKQETIEYFGVTGVETSATIQEYTGFHFNQNSHHNVASGVVKADGSLLLKLYYDRNSYQIKFEECDLEPISYLYGQAIGQIPQPTKEGHTFDGWLEVIPQAMPASDLTLTAKWTTNKYAIKFVSEGVVLQNTLVEFGTMPVYEGETPVKEATAEFTYTFSGWNPQVEVVSGEATYTAEFDATTNTYLVEFMVGELVTQSEILEYGVLPVYSSVAPAQDATAQYSYTFSGWSPAIETVKGPQTYVAQFDAIVNKYEINFYNGEELLQSSLVEYGTLPVYGGELPTQAATTQFTYIFSGWNPALEEVVNDQDYYATFESVTNSYVVKFISEGVVLQEGEVEFGQTPVYNGETPTKAATAEYTYTFAGWEPEVEAVSGVATYTATFTATLNKYLIKFMNGEEELQSSLVEYGTLPAYLGEEPTKAATAQYTYIFSGWDPEVVEVTGEATYVAQFSSDLNSYVIKFMNGEDVLQDTEYDYGVTPDYLGPTPTKEATAQYTYTFSGWDAELVPVTGEATYHAVYHEWVNKYLIQFVNGEEVLQSTEVEYGTLPVYNGEAPIKAADAQFTYTFSGWNPEVVEVTGEATYTAQFSTTVNKYLIKFMNGEEELQSSEVEYGELPAYLGVEPTKASDFDYEYHFLGWNSELVEVTEAKTYTAVFLSSVIQYQDLAFYMEGSGNTLNHIDGSGIWLWLQNESIGLTGANMNEFSARALVYVGDDPDPVAVTDNFFSDLASEYVRHYVILAAAPNAAEITEVYLQVKHGDEYYLGLIMFKNNKVYDPNAIYMVTGLETTSKVSAYYAKYDNGVYDDIDLSEPVAFGTQIAVTLNIKNSDVNYLYGIFINGQKITPTINGNDIDFLFTVEGNTAVNIVVISDADILPLELYLDGEGTSRNHIEGAGAWIWLKSSSLDVTPQNKDSMILNITSGDMIIAEAFFSDFESDYYRLYVRTTAAPAANEIITYAVEIFDGSKVYQAEVQFLNGELYAPSAAKLNGVDYSSIQAAIDAATDGDFIYIYPGTWNEEVNVNKSVVLLTEANLNVPGYSDQRQNESIITAPMTISAAGVTINGLTFSGNGTIKVMGNNVTLNSIKTDAEPVKLVDNFNAQVYAGANVSNLTVHDSLFDTGALTGSRCCLGITSSYTATNWSITNNHFVNEVAESPSTDSAIRIQKFSGNLEITDNVFNFATGGSLIYLNESRTNTVFTCTIWNNTINSLVSSSAIIFNIPVNNVNSSYTIEHNVINTTNTPENIVKLYSCVGSVNFYFNTFGSIFKKQQSGTVTVTFEGNCYKAAYSGAAPSDYQAYEAYNEEDLEVAYQAWLHPSVSYNLNGGAWNGTEGTTQLIHNVAYTLPTNVEREGYEFLGWFDADDNEVTSVLNKQVTVTAKWGETRFNITYNLNGGVLVPCDEAQVLKSALFTDFIQYKSSTGSELAVISKTETTTKPTWWGYITLKSTTTPGLFTIVQIATNYNGITETDWDYALIWHTGAIDTTNKAIMNNILNNASSYLDKLVVLKNMPSASTADAEIVAEFYPENAVLDTTMYNKSEGAILTSASRYEYTFGGWYDNSEFNGNPINEIVAGTTGDVELFAKWIHNFAEVNGHMYETFNEALEAASDGDIITMFRGETDEVININKSVTVIGPNANVLGKASRVTETVFKGAITISAANVTLKGLKFIDAATIMVSANNATIENCYVKATAIKPASNNRKGMIVSASTISDLTIRGNYLYCGAYVAGPIDLDSLASNVVIDNNYFTNGITASNNVNEALVLYNAAGELTITNNEFIFPTDNWMIMVYGSTLQRALIKDNTLNTANNVNHTSGIAIYNTPSTCVVDFIHNKFYSTTGTTFRFTGGEAGAIFNFLCNYFDANSPVKFNALSTIEFDFNGDCYSAIINSGTNVTPTDYPSNANYDLEALEEAYPSKYQAWLNPGVTYDLDGGSWNGETGVTQFDHNVTFTLPRNVEKEGFVFVGWFDENNQEVVKVRNDQKSVKAKWELPKGNVSWDANGGNVGGETTGSFEYNVGDNPTLPTPEREGYVFRGWYQNDTLVTTIEAGDYDLVAHWDLMVVFINENTIGYGTLAEALDDVQDGDTIHLLEGTYAGATINKSITLKGPNAGINPNTGTRSAEAIFNSDILIAADGITIDGIQTTGVTRIVTTTSKDISNLTITNVLVRGSTLNVDSSYSTTGPLYLVAGSSRTLHNIVVTNCRFDEYASGRPMIAFIDGIENLIIENNVFIGIYKTFNDGIKTDSTSRPAVKGNVSISNNYFQDFQQYVIWFRTYGPGNYVLQNNSFKHIGSSDYAANNAAFAFIKYIGEKTDDVHILVEHNEMDQGMVFLRIDSSTNNVSTHTATVNYNKLHDNCAGTYYIKNGSTVSVICDCNYWGTAAPAEAKFMNVVEHINDCASLEEVDFRYELYQLYNHYGTALDPFDVDTAKQYIDSLDDNAVSPYEIVVSGKVKSSSYNSTYSSYTMWLEDNNHENGVKLYSTQLDLSDSDLYHDDNALVDANLVCKGYAKKYVNGATVELELAYISSLSASPHITSLVLPEYNISINQSDHGIIESNAVKGYKFASVTISITPEEGYMIDKLVINDEDVLINENSYQFILMSDTTITPVFKLIEYRVLFSNIKNGSVEATDNTIDLNSLEPNAEVEFVVSASEFYRIGKVYVNGAEVLLDADNKFTVTIDGNKTITAEFVVDTKKDGSSVDNAFDYLDAITYLKATNGSTSAGEFYIKGVVSEIVEAFTSEHNNTSVYIGVKDNAETRFEIFRVAATSTTDIEVGDEIVVKSKLTKYQSTYETTTGPELISIVKAQFAVSVDTCEHGSLSVNKSSVHRRENIEITVNADENYVISKLYANGVAQNFEVEGGKIIIEDIKTDTIYSAEFTLIKLNVLTLNYDDTKITLQVTGATDLDNILSGTEITISVVALSGYVITQITKDGVEVELENGQLVFTITDDTAIEIIADPDYSGRYAIVYENSDSEYWALNGSLTSDATSNYVVLTRNGNEILSTRNDIFFTIAKQENGYSIQADSGKYIGHSGSGNSLTYSDSILVNTIDLDRDFIIKSSDNYNLSFNTQSGQTRFRYFSSEANKKIKLIPISDITILSDQYKVNADKDALTISQDGQEITEGFTLPSVGTVYDSAITWNSSDTTALELSGTTATLHRAASDVTVTLTATLTLNEAFITKDFTVIVKAAVAQHNVTFTYTSGQVTINRADSGSYDEGTFTFTVSANNGYEIVSVSDASGVLTATNGVYSINLVDDTAITIVSQEKAISYTTTTISFANTNQRDSYSQTQQVWHNGVVTFTNNKGSGSNVGDYSNPVRLYQNSEMIVSCTNNMTQIVINCNSNSYATALGNSTIVGGTMSVSGKVVTITLSSPGTSVTITLGAQVRIDSIVVTHEE